MELGGVAWGLGGGKCDLTFWTAKFEWEGLNMKGKKGNDVNMWRKPEHRAERQSVSWQGEIRWLGSQRCFPGIQSLFDTLCLSTAHLYVIELEPLGKNRSHSHREWTREAAKAFFFPSFTFFFLKPFFFPHLNQDLVRRPWSATSGIWMLKES